MPSAPFVGQGIGPGVTSASMVGNIVYVTFSEAMSLTGLTTPANYTITGMTVVSVGVVPGMNNTMVGVTVTGFTPLTPYTVTVINVTDTAGNAIA